MFYSRILEFALFGLILAHLFYSPYTKVEESFNIQAIHDILNYGVYPEEVLQNYDHIKFPGVVPRTFIGSVVIAGFVKAIDLAYSQLFGSSFLVDKAQAQLHVQIIVRAVLGLANVFGIMAIRKSLDKLLSFSGNRKFVGFFYTLMFLSQFHILFYATRTLPNFIALPLVNFGLSKILVGDMTGLSWLAFSGVVFRMEVGVLAFIIAVVSSLVFGQSDIFQNTITLIISSLIGCLVSFKVDSYFWREFVLPELVAFKFNIVQGKSIEWGVEPYSAYFAKYIVNFFRPPHVLFLCLFGMAVDPARTALGLKKDGKSINHHTYFNSLRVLGLSAVLFVAAMSFQPHKEWRFIVYIIPIFNALAGNGLAHLWTNRSKLFAHKALFFLMIGSSLISFVMSTFMSFASSFNYPGGDAIDWVNEYVSDKGFPEKVVVHMEVPACMTGITRFTQFHDDRIVYDKTENVAELAQIWNNVSILITHRNLQSSKFLESSLYKASNWKELVSIGSFKSVRALAFVKNTVAMMKEPKSRNDFVLSIFDELKEGKFDSLRSFLKGSIEFQNSLWIYERTGQDDLKDFAEPRKSIQYKESAEKETDEIPFADIDPEQIKEEINQQIDELEEELQHDEL